MTGYTAEEARRAARLPARSCFWKRDSELAQMGLTELTGEMRRGPFDQPQQVHRITSMGRAVALKMITEGVAVIPDTPHPAARISDPLTSHISDESPARRIRATSQQGRLLQEYYLASLGE